MKDGSNTLGTLGAFTAPAAGVPDSVAVPLPLSRKVKPTGNAPDSIKVPAGTPLVMTVNELSVPTVNVSLFTLVNAGP